MYSYPAQNFDHVPKETLEVVLPTYTGRCILFSITQLRSFLKADELEDDSLLQDYMKSSCEHYIDFTQTHIFKYIAEVYLNKTRFVGNSMYFDKFVVHHGPILGLDSLSILRAGESTFEPLESSDFEVIIQGNGFLLNVTNDSVFETLHEKANYTLRADVKLGFSNSDSELEQASKIPNHIKQCIRLLIGNCYLYRNDGEMPKETLTHQLMMLTRSLHIN